MQCIVKLYVADVLKRIAGFPLLINKKMDIKKIRFRKVFVWKFLLEFYFHKRHEKASPDRSGNPGIAIGCVVIGLLRSSQCQIATDGRNYNY